MKIFNEFAQLRFDSPWLVVAFALGTEHFCLVTCGVYGGSSKFDGTSNVSWVEYDFGFPRNEQIMNRSSARSGSNIYALSFLMLEINSLIVNGKCPESGLTLK